MRRLVSSLIVTVLLSCGIAVSQPPTLTQFSSDMQMKSSHGETMTGKMYMGNRKMRMDVNSHGMNMRIITDQKAMKSYMIMLDQKMYMENPINAQAQGPGPKVPTIDLDCDPDHYTCKTVGTETINGRLCEKHVRTAKDEGNEAENSTTWVDVKTHMPIRVVKGDGTQIDFTNMKEGPQEASLFEVPAGFQPFNPMMMGGRPPKH